MRQDIVVRRRMFQRIRKYQQGYPNKHNLTSYDHIMSYRLAEISKQYVYNKYNDSFKYKPIIIDYISNKTLDYYIYQIINDLLPYIDNILEGKSISVEILNLHSIYPLFTRHNVIFSGCYLMFNIEKYHYGYFNELSDVLYNEIQNINTTI